MGQYKNSVVLFSLLFLLTLSTSMNLSAITNIKKLKFYTVDVGTGLSVFIEAPVSYQDRPIRILIDGGIGIKSLSHFLAHESVQFPPINKRGETNIIDYVILTHPHSDHLKGLQQVLENYNVRNIIESKQESTVGYLRHFKKPALQNLIDHGGNYYVVGLPYPRGFDQDLLGQPFNEYRISEQNLPSFLTGLRRKGEFTTQVKAPRFPFYPEDVEQVVEWPIQSFFSIPKEEDSTERTLEEMKGLRSQLREQIPRVKVRVLPIGTRFQLDKDIEFTILHGDTYAGLNGQSKDITVYGAKEGSRYQRESYYSSYDANDLSIALRFQYKKSSFFIAGDTEGRSGRPDQGKSFSLSELFETVGGSSERIKYDSQDIKNYVSKLNEHPLVNLSSKDLSFVGPTEKLLKTTRAKFSSYNLVTPVGFSNEEFNVNPRNFSSATDMKRQLKPQFAGTTLRWPYLFNFHKVLTRNHTQTHATLKQRFNNWVKSGHLVCEKQNHGECAFRPNTDEDFRQWDVSRVMQVAHRLYFSDPDYSRFLAAVTLNSPFFQDYLKQPATRSELHMLHLAEQIKKEGRGDNILKSDVHIFGHHGSFTSSSLPLLHKVDPNVGIISADDRNYSGSNLPDFQTLFWGLNTLLPGVREQLLTGFAHTDIQHFLLNPQRELEGLSHSVQQITQLRGSFSIPIWRTDWNDNIEDSNLLRDNIRIVTDGSRPVFQWSRWNRRSILGQLEKIGFSDDITRGAYFDFRLGTGSHSILNAPPLKILSNNAKNLIRPIDPNREFSTFSTESKKDY